MIIRKLFSGLLAGLMVLLIYFLLEQSGFVILIGSYLLPILLIYGVPASVVSDFITKKLSGLLRGILSLIIHLLFAISFVLIPNLFLESERAILFSDLSSLNSLVFVTALLSSSLLWCIDELLRSKIARVMCEKIGDLKIY
ncbi:hypothetical protein [Psychrobacillus sp. NPDC096389]|uniref:hypothetical protein n=1 Tax=Psychrobacillus sp. NPDC096389 TaxID=3364490 RepID=UPI0038103957